MISNIVNTFRQQALQHLTIQSFYYNRNYELGSGNDKYPLLWLEDPIAGRNDDNLFVNTANFAILFLPNSDKSIVELQNLAFSTGLNIMERIKQDTSSEIRIRPNWTYTTLQNYYDDDACGCRFTVNFNQLNMQNLCLIEEQFDANKPDTLHTDSTLPHLNVFAGKLPHFDVKTRKNKK